MNLTCGALPNLIVIGAMKSGTTSLHSYLNLHPEIEMSRQKELIFFIKERNWDRGLDWYRSHFRGTTKIKGESSPGYTNYPTWKNVPQRMFSVVPNTKIIYLLRNPIERIVSHYVHDYASGKEDRNFETAMSELNNNRYVKRSQYFAQIEQYLRFYPSSQILLITSEELARLPQKTMRAIFKFLQVDPDFQFKFKVDHAPEVLKFGTSIVNPRFQFDTKMHASFRKRRLTISRDSKVNQILAAITRPLPPEIKFHAERILYRPFSQKISRPVINPTLRKRLLEQLSEDLYNLKAYGGHDFGEWDLG